ncbi:V-type ATP synthase subunit E [Deltaproteobacteria bacterium IMCC39524]|nr:V-type ATP synthase subunit E [Deltaproteobacteria bacterium IMCC39524]
MKIALQREGEEQVRAFWQAAEEKVAKRRQELKEEQQLLRLEAERQLQSEVSRRRNSLLAKSRRQVMASRLHAEALLDERLQGLASRLLTELTEKNREVLWQALCAELPPAEWGKITVSQASQGLAARDFPTAEVELDDAIAGGLIATSRSGVRVDNTLACRLRRAWPDLLPQLMSELRRLVDSDETA